PGPLAVMSQTAGVACRLLPTPGSRGRTVWFAPEQVAQGFVRTDLVEDIVRRGLRGTENARVSRPGSQDPERVVGPTLAQLPHQTLDGGRVVQADVGSGVAGQQGLGRVIRPILAQDEQESADAPRVVQAGGGNGPGCEGAGPVVGPVLAQRTEQFGDG